MKQTLKKVTPKNGPPTIFEASLCGNGTIFNLVVK